MTAIQALGGLGIFLLGMVIMTDGLHSLAGNAMRRALTRFTRTPLIATLTGALSTAVLQSSSATTVAAVGFVGVGLLSFSGALGIIFGANLGTTITGWLVALIGFKLKLNLLVLPLILVGVIFRLFFKGTLARAGYAIAGFGLLFVGIEMMQQGMAGLEGVLTPETFPPDTILGRLQLIMLGIAVTIVTQSSSAGVAAAMTAVSLGNIHLSQAMCLVIGMDVGTTITALMATIGGTVGAKRTGLSHVLFNLVSASIAFIILTPFLNAWEAIAPGQIGTDAEIVLVAFHSCFNLIAIALMLPFIGRFAVLIETMLPEQVGDYQQKLDKSLLKEPKIAISTAKHVMDNELEALLRHLQALLDSSEDAKRANLPEVRAALDEVYGFLEAMHLRPDEGEDWKNLFELIHVLDHMQRLHERCAEEEVRAITVKSTPELAEFAPAFDKTIKSILDEMRTLSWQESPKLARKTARDIHRQVGAYRDKVITEIAQGQQDSATATSKLEAVRWLERVSRHLHHLVRHLEQVKL